MNDYRYAASLWVLNNVVRDIGVILGACLHASDIL